MGRRIGLAFLALVITLLFGTTGLMVTEHLSLAQAFYFTVETITTVGYGDFEIKSDAGHVFIIILMIGGAGVMLYFAGLMMAFLIEGQLAGAYGRRKMNKKIEQLQDHIIVCGAGRVGKQVLYRLRKEGHPSVVIELREDLAQEFIEEGYLVIHNDATQDDVLKKAGIVRAKGLVTALPDDSLNVFVTLTAKGLNPNIQVVARMDRLESENKLLRAGADKVISPAILGGWRMAMSILKPISIDYIETVIQDHNIEMEIMELKVDQGSCLIGRTLTTSGIKQQTGAMILAIVRENRVISNPSAQEEILERDLLIVLGLRDQLRLLEKVAANHTKLKPVDFG
ncbi:K+ transport system, NAD-binding component [Desulfosporosinus acidiphilus SJ4]|uniref:K+ transport system, NAD-binding component n=1 Tax=Desulfosporosinus acidiphilus (strain DSM 22704 / JCM 16185 / SJ4) TaxID=646529 RepID=I4D807_DESAJ|nr:potassium channel protein [Desulfosporosinus acidiphilus]AFM41931.1 K+ transport system, NAD-binding component [Desulfosporosinus acidiphilus SJ4]